MRKWILFGLLCMPSWSFAQGFGAEDTVEKPRGETWDVYGTARARLDTLSSFTLDEMANASEREVFSSGFLRLGGYWRPMPKMSLDFEIEALNGFYGGDGVALGKVASEKPFHLSREDWTALNWVLPRKLAVNYRDSWGALTAGIQNWTWGSGILSNDGEEDALFGDDRQGNVVARVGGAWTPWRTDPNAGQARGLAFFAAGDFVVRDDNAQALDGDLAFGGQSGMRLQNASGEYGALLGLRYQLDRPDAFHPATEQPWVFVVPMDVYFQHRMGSVEDTVSIFLEGEAALLAGRTNRSYGEETVNGADVFSHALYTSTRFDVNPMRMSIALDFSYASGDQDPRDNRIEQFTMHTDHNVGLILYEEILPMLSARAADRVADPKLVGSRAPGLRHGIVQGGVHNSLAFHPTFRWRPWGNVDLRLGYLLARAAVAPVDLYSTAKNGGYAAGYGGGAGRTYGQEFNASIRDTWELPADCALEVGLEGGVFLPGDAFENIAMAPVTSLRGRVDIRW